MNIPKNKYLGKLCKRGHDWNGTGKSLKYNGGNCVKCATIALQKWLKNNTEKYREYQRKYQKGFYKRHRERYIGRNLEQRRIDFKKNVDNLDDVYVKHRLVTGTTLKFADIPQWLVEMKRSHLKIIRSIKERKKCQTSLKIQRAKDLKQ